VTLAVQFACVAEEWRIGMTSVAQIEGYTFA
jgi:hypothetical protein